MSKIRYFFIVQVYLNANILFYSNIYATMNNYLITK